MKLEDGRENINKSFSKYDKYNKCSICLKIKAQCICGKDSKSTSIITTITKGSVKLEK